MSRVGRHLIVGGLKEGGEEAAEQTAENEADIAAFAKENNIDMHNLADRRQLVKNWASATGYTVQKPNWFKQLVSNIRIWMHNHGLPVKNLSDDDIANIIYRSAKAARDQRRATAKENLAVGDGARFLAFDEQGQYFPAPDEWGTAYTSMTGKGLQAIEFLLEKKNGFVPAAFHRQEIGDIDIVYGKTGYGIEDKGGYGLAHISKRHPDIIWSKIVDTIDNGKFEPERKGKRLIVSQDGKIILRINQKGRNWVISALSIASTEELSAVNRAKGLPANLNPKGLYTIGDVLDNFKSPDEKNPKKTDTDKSDGNGAFFTLNSNASEELKRQVKAMQPCVGIASTSN